jgi:hypothetical protein
MLSEASIKFSIAVPAGSPTHIDVDGLLTGCRLRQRRSCRRLVPIFRRSRGEEKRRKVSPFLQVLLS